MPYAPRSWFRKYDSEEMRSITLDFRASLIYIVGHIRLHEAFERLLKEKKLRRLDGYLFLDSCLQLVSKLNSYGTIGRLQHGIGEWEPRRRSLVDLKRVLRRHTLHLPREDKAELRRVGLSREEVMKLDKSANSSTDYLRGILVGEGKSHIPSSWQRIIDPV